MVSGFKDGCKNALIIRVQSLWLKVHFMKRYTDVLLACVVPSQVALWSGSWWRRTSLTAATLSAPYRRARATCSELAVSLKQEPDRSVTPQSWPSWQSNMKARPSLYQTQSHQTLKLIKEKWRWSEVEDFVKDLKVEREDYYFGSVNRLHPIGKT